MNFIVEMADIITRYNDIISWYERNAFVRNIMICLKITYFFID